MQFQVIGDVMQAVVVHLQEGEEVRAEAGAMMFMTPGIHMDTRMAGGVFGGEGLFLATLRGPGKAILQTLPFSRLAGRIVGKPSEGSSGLGGLAGTLGDIGKLIGGD
jgi:uncharacterized protein (AIM24 family)